jgi:hypothetical protein
MPEAVFFPSPARLRSWFEKHHATAGELMEISARGRRIPQFTGAAPKTGRRRAKGAA